MEESVLRMRGSGGFKVADLIIVVIVILSLLSIGWQTSSIMENADKEKDKKSTVCLRDFK